MLGYVAIVHGYLLKIVVSSFKARRGLQRQNCSRKNSAQANTEQSQTPRSVSHFWIFGKCNCQLGAVLLACGKSDSVLC